MSLDTKVEILQGDPGKFGLSFKLILIGNQSVGKSCLTIRASKGIFEEDYHPTVGFEFLSFFIKIEELNIKLELWDTCGQEVYRSLISGFYRKSSLALLVYSIDNKNSFENLEMWLNEIKTFGNPDIIIFLIGNKADLEEKREVSKEMAEDFCKIHNIKLFLETSAKTGFNAQKVFIEAAKLLYKKHLKYKGFKSTPYSFKESENKKNIMENNGETEENDKNRKKKCC